VAAGNTIRIVVAKGRFKSVAEAACSEKQVEWFSPDPDADAVTECYAAVELKAHLASLYTHANNTPPAIDFASPAATRSAALRIILGTPKTNPLIARLAPKGIPSNGEGCLITAVRGATGKAILIAARTPKGVLNGVYRYLEELGMYWPSPDQPQAVWPKRVTPWRPSLRLRESPRFELRGFCGGGGKTPEKPLRWMARNRMNFSEIGTLRPAFAKKLGIRLVGGGHVFESIFDPDRKIKGGKLYDVHPEWFAMRHGKRVRSPGHACMSTPAAVEFLLDQAIDEIIRDSQKLDIYRFWPPDVWTSWCECPRCRRKGNDADRYLKLVHKLRGRLDAAHRAGKIGHRIVLFFIVYEGSGIYPPPTESLPKGFDTEMNQMEVWPINRCYAHRQADPDCREFNRHYWDDLKGWLRVFKGPKIMGEYYNVSQYRDMATVFSRVMFEDVRDYAAAGFTGLQYMHAAPGHWGPRALTNWQLARLQWNPDRDYDAMLRTFFANRFGPLATRAKRLYRLLDRAMSNLSTVKSWLSGSVSSRLRELYSEAMEYRSTEELFVFDHLRLHRPAGSRGEIGFGLNNLDDMIKAVRRVRDGLACLRRARGLSPVVKANLDEDLWQVDYTLDFLGIHHEFALYWEANRYGTGDSSLHRRRILALADKLASIVVPEPALPPRAGRDSANALARTALEGPLQKAFGYTMGRSG